MTYEFSDEALRLIRVVSMKDCNGNVSEFVRRTGIAASRLGRRLEHASPPAKRESRGSCSSRTPTFRDCDSLTAGVIGGANRNIQGMTVIGRVGRFASQETDESRIRASERSRVLDSLMADENITPEAKVMIYNRMKRQEA